MKTLRLLASAAIVLGFIISGTANAAPAKTIKTNPIVASTTQTVDINTADAKTLESLKGIGDKKAKAIIDCRTKNGAFKSIDDLAKVKGINAKFIARLQKNNPGMVVANPIE